MFGAAAGPPVYVLEACARLWRTIFKMSQDLWDCGEPNECDDDEDWSEGDSETTPAIKAHKRRMAAARQTRDSSSEEREQQPPKAVDDEDDPFVHALGQQQPLKRQKLNGMGTPLVLNSDDADNAAVPRSSGRIALAAGCDQIDMTVLGSKAQRVADTQRRLREQLQQLKQLEQQEESDEPEVAEQSPEPAMPQQPQPVVDVMSPADDHANSDTSASPAVTAEETCAGADGEEGRLPLKFKTQGEEDVMVRIHPDEPLQAALARFRQYVCEQGWGAVCKFLSPDGDKLTGHETARGLGLEAEDIIEVYLS